MANRAQNLTTNAGLIAMIDDELQDTVTGFLLAGVGNVDLRMKSNYLIVDSREKCITFMCSIKPCVRRRVLDSDLGLFDVNAGTRPHIAWGHLQQCFPVDPLLIIDTESRRGGSTNVKAHEDIIGHLK
uniref:V-type proton ATPase subunit F n=1 Tax=Tanacetum cinerariifolium TaxID=118510 RepID=A0A6L2JYU3_TANCI|nr:V-type proton ATPase subunit F [Tanacetum cinerariifolium]